MKTEYTISTLNRASGAARETGLRNYHAPYEAESKMVGEPYPYHGFDSTVLFLLLCLRVLHLSCLFVLRLESPAPARRKERQ